MVVLDGVATVVLAVVVELDTEASQVSTIIHFDDNVYFAGLWSLGSFSYNVPSPSAAERSLRSRTVLPKQQERFGRKRAVRENVLPLTTGRDKTFNGHFGFVNEPASSPMRRKRSGQGRAREGRPGAAVGVRAWKNSGMMSV